MFEIAEALRTHGVQLWLPETLGPVDLDDPAHQAVLIELGARSLREVQRSRRRATEAMRVQTRYQGRYLGGRPPYGYRLVDAGPHPNASQARWGRQLQRLDPDPATAGHVRWIFARRLEGDSMAAIARSLNERGVPCPSAQDPARNQHRRARGWSVTTVAAILANPRYTGRQVWNRQATRYHADTTLDAGGTGAPVRGRNTRPDWVISERPAHPALVSEADFIAAQRVSALCVPAHGERHCYLLVSVLRCAICGRRMTAHWAHGRAWYRCRHGITSATPADSGRPRTLYLREDRLIQDITVLLREHGLPDPPTGSALAACLKQRMLMIACSWQSTTLEHDQPGRAGPGEPRDLGHDRAR